MTLALASKCSHKDENSTRAADFDQKFSKAQHKYLNDVYGSNQFYLAALATHPDFQGRGYGEQLVLSGTDMAPTLGLDVVTLIATPMGEPVYFSLGFQSIANFSVTSIDGDMAFPYDVMIHT
jgi:GNAT superfamily N-acetyltransferase